MYYIVETNNKINDEGDTRIMNSLIYPSIAQLIIIKVQPLFHVSNQHHFLFVSAGVF